MRAHPLTPIGLSHLASSCGQHPRLSTRLEARQDAYLLSRLATYRYAFQRLIDIDAPANEIVAFVRAQRKISLGWRTANGSRLISKIRADSAISGRSHAAYRRLMIAKHVMRVTVSQPIK
jgi:hypothetical protein